jgi:hypothetical protein
MSRSGFFEKVRLGATELRMVASTALGLFAGRKVWLPPEKPAPTAWVNETPRRNLGLARDIYRERLQSESSGVEAVRRRAEFALTAVIAALGLSSAALDRLWTAAAYSAWLIIPWGVGVAIVVVAILIFAGVAVSNKTLGNLQEQDFVRLRDPRRAELRQYVLAAHTTSRTRRAMVTVFRDGVLIALVGLALLGAAHVTSWAVPLPDAPVSVDLNTNSSTPVP